MTHVSSLGKNSSVRGRKSKYASVHMNSQGPCPRALTHLPCMHIACRSFTHPPPLACVAHPLPPKITLSLIIPRTGSSFDQLFVFSLRFITHWLAELNQLIRYQGSSKVFHHILSGLYSNGPIIALQIKSNQLPLRYLNFVLSRLRTPNIACTNLICLQ